MRRRAFIKLALIGIPLAAAALLQDRPIEIGGRLFRLVVRPGDRLSRATAEFRGITVSHGTERVSCTFDPPVVTYEGDLVYVESVPAKRLRGIE